MKGITKADFLHAERVCKDFEKIFFENFRKMSLKIYELNPVGSLSAPELT